MTLVKASLVAATAALATLAASTASAASYDFTLLDNNGVTVDASGVLNLTGDVIDSITGSVTGFGTITGLIANPNSPGYNVQGDIIYDNLFKASVPGVDNDGVFLSTSSGANLNLFNLDSSGTNFPNNTAAVYEDNVGYVANGTFSVTAVAVPEPSAWALMLLGVGLAGATLRMSPKQATAKTRAASKA
jgi:hypothetical protein